MLAIFAVPNGTQITTVSDYEIGHHRIRDRPHEIPEVLF